MWWPLLVGLVGVALLAVAWVGWSNLDPPSVPTPIAAGTATALAAAPASGTATPPGAPPPSSLPEGPANPATPPSYPVQTPPPAAPSAPPSRLQISTLRIDAPVVPVGVETTGDIEIPTDVHTLGWYRYGAGPGAPAGSIVIVGHLDSATQGIGTLAYLRTIEADATITVTTADGQRWNYRVVGRQAYSKTSLPLPALFSTEGAPRLTLITCGGPFDRTTRSYRDNIVVTAIPS